MRPSLVPRMLAGCVCLLVLLSVAVPAKSHDPTYQFTIIDLPALGISPPRFLEFNALANNGTLAGFFPMDQGYGARVAQDRTLQPVFCPADVFARYPFAANKGPQVMGMNNDKVIVANDAGVTALYGLTQTPDGVCTFFLVPQSTGTLATGINDLGQVVGVYSNAPGLSEEPGLLRFHGFLKDAGGIMRLDGLGPHDVVFPTAINALGQIVGYMYSDVQPDNSYVYHAFFYDHGTYQVVDHPSGRDVWLLGLNNLGQAVGVVGTDGVSGGQAFVLAEGEFFPIAPPTATTVFVQPTAINDHGRLVGRYAERDVWDNLIFHNFVATPIKHATKGHGTPVAKNGTRQRIQVHGPSKDAQRLTPEIAEDGTVVVRRGAQVLGRAHH